MEDYLQTLRKQLRGFRPEEQDALMEEIQSHIESGENDPGLGRDEEQRKKKLMEEMGPPDDMRNGFQAVYRPGRLMDYLLILLPFLCYPYLNSFYIDAVMPRYAGGALLLDVLIHLPLVMIGLWRRSAALTLFWSAILISQLSFVSGRLYWYYGLQTVFWALLLIALLFLAGKILWKHRNDPFTVGFGLLMVGLSIAGSLLNILSVIGPFGLLISRSRWLAEQYAAFGLLDRSLLVLYIHVRDFAAIFSVLALALFFIPTQRELRWAGLGLAGLAMGLGHRFLLEDQSLMAPWIYLCWVVLPLMIAAFGWWLERDKARRMQFAA